MSEKKSSPRRPTLILVRHAHTAMAGRFCGQIDPPLSPEGLTQLPELNERLRSYSLTHIFSSDLQRARQTAESIACRHKLPVHLLASLREIAFGSWEGLNWEQVMAQDRDYAQRWLDLYPSIPPPGGEEFEHFRERIQNAMNEIATQAQRRLRCDCHPRRRHSHLSRQSDARPQNRRLQTSRPSVCCTPPGLRP